MEKKFRVRKMTEGDGSVAIWQVDGDIKPQDINEAVYMAMCEAGQDVLRQSVCRLSGEHTAVELAGKLGGIPAFDTPETMAPEVRIYVGMISIGYKQQAPMFTCSFATDDVFEQVAEWEGVMGMAPKKYHRFKCKTKDDKKFEPKPYVRHRGYHPATVSYKMTHDRINQKFETLGKLYQSLTSDGMRKAYTVACAAHRWDKADYAVRDMAKWAMLWKLQHDYGKDPDAKPVYFVGTDFQYGPECYKEADQTYYNILVRHFEQMLLDAPKPAWPERGDIVTIKDDARTLKKHDGKHLVDSVSARLSADGRRIEWTVAVSVGRYECEHFLPEQLEKAEDVRRKKSDVRCKNQRSTAEGKVKEDVKVAPEHHTSGPSLSERLRQALQARLAA